MSRYDYMLDKVTILIHFLGLFNHSLNQIGCEDNNFHDLIYFLCIIILILSFTRIQYDENLIHHPLKKNLLYGILDPNEKKL